VAGRHCGVPVWRSKTRSVQVALDLSVFCHYFAADLPAGLSGNEVDDLQALVEGFGEPIHQASVQLAEDLGVLFGDGGDGAVVEAVFGPVAFLFESGLEAALAHLVLDQFCRAGRAGRRL